MGRLGLRFGALLALSSCIIYQVERDEPVIVEPDEPIDPSDPVVRPLPTDLSLVTDEGEPGETLRTTLMTDEPRGLEGLQAVRFERDVTVVDAVFAFDEAELVIAIGSDAEPGEIDVTAQFREGATVRIGGAFTILGPDAPEPTGDTGAPTSTGDTGSAGP
ncbi:MAG: hypothetical protein AAF211_04455 [Myxococcota bacterium]